MSTTTNKETTTKPKKARGIGKHVNELLLKDKDNEEILASVQDKFPGCKTTLPSVNWYRTRARQDGLAVKSSRELKAARNKAKEAAK